MNTTQIALACIISICSGCTPKPPMLDSAKPDSSEIDPSEVELANLFKEAYSDVTVKPPIVKPLAPGPPTVESLYEAWEAELTNGIIGINPDGTRSLLGPGFSDELRIPHLASGKQLADFRPRIDMVNYCILKYNTGAPTAGLVGHVLRAAYPGQLTGMTVQEMFQKAKRLAEAESR